jgi:hypothetical protein
MASDLRRASRGTMTTPRYNHDVSPLTAAVQMISSNKDLNIFRPISYDGWQDEAWAFYEGLGEFSYGVSWFSEALSRCRLNVAEVSPGGDEPQVLTSGPAVDLIEQLAGGPAGQSALLKSFAVQLSVPGECYLVGHDINGIDYESFAGIILDAEPDDSGHVWTVQPKTTIKPSQRTFKTMLGREQRGYEMQVDDAVWVPLPGETLIARIWDRDERMPWRASSPARAALATMREIDMYNRYIMATLISRVALNGVWLIPDEVTLPVNPAYADQQDPFFAELLDVMRSVIKNPGSPASAAPLPLRVPGDLVDKFKHMTFATPLDDKIFEAREGALRRLAASLNLPQEVLTGLGNTNYWSSATLEESAIKIHIAPKIEVITRCVTVGYLYPMLKSAGESLVTSNGNRIVVWYDTSQLTQRPDRSDLAMQLNDRVVISDAATRRETGFTEADAPTDEERNEMLQRGLVRQGGQLAGPAYEMLTGDELALPQPTLPGMPPLPGQQAPAVGGPRPRGPGNETSTAGQPATQKKTDDKTKLQARPGDAPNSLNNNQRQSATSGARA